MADLLNAAPLGLLGGAVGALFMLLLRRLQRLFAGMKGRVVLRGLLGGLGMGLIGALYRISRPHDALVDDVDAAGGTVYRGVADKETVLTEPGLIVYRFDAPLVFAHTIISRDDSTMSGQADCNTFTGTYSQADGFFINLGAVTKAACGAESLDRQHLQLLGAVAAGGPVGSGNLALETAGGEQRIEFVDCGAAPAP